MKAKDALIAALSDTLKVVRQSDSSSKATIAVIQTEKARDFLQLQTKDKEVQELQKLVKDYKNVLQAGSSVTKGLIETLADLKTQKPPTIIKRDTVVVDSGTVEIYPTYEDSVVNKWVKVKGIMSKDSSDFKIAVNNEFTAVMGYDKKNKAPFIEYHLLNPYSTMKTLRSYQVSIPKPKKWVVGAGIGYGFGTEFKHQPFIGVFAGKSLIRF